MYMPAEGCLPCPFCNEDGADGGFEYSLYSELRTPKLNKNKDIYKHAHVSYVIVCGGCGASSGDFPIQPEDKFGSISGEHHESSKEAALLAWNLRRNKANDVYTKINEAILAAIKGE